MSIDKFIETWSSFIKEPVSINSKQGFLLKNGLRILFSEQKLSNASKATLRRVYRHSA